MSNLWNLRDPPLPVMSTCRIDDTNLDLHFYRKIITEAVETFEQQPHLHAEATLLSRFIYRMKTKLRSDHGLKEMQKLNTAVRRYLTLDLPKVLQQFLEFLPETKGAERYYPTLGILDYILIRLQGTSKLMIRAAECARYCALFMKNRISIGHLWKIAYIALGIAARLFALSKNLVKVCCSLYNNLLPIRGYLNDSSGYVGADYIFPDRLEKWLDQEWLFEETVVEEVVIAANEKLLRFRSVDDSDVEFSGEYLEIDDDIEWIDEFIDITGGPVVESKGVEAGKGCENLDVQEKPKMLTEKEEDIGEAIVPLINDNYVKLEMPKIISQEEDDIGEAVVPRINENTLRKKALTGRELKGLKRKSSEADGSAKKKIKFVDEATNVNKKYKLSEAGDFVQKRVEKKNKLGVEDKFSEGKENYRKKNNLDKADELSDTKNNLNNGGKSPKRKSKLGNPVKLNESMDVVQAIAKKNEYKLSKEVKSSKPIKNKKNNLHNDFNGTAKNNLHNKAMDAFTGMAKKKKLTRTLKMKTKKKHEEKKQNNVSSIEIGENCEVMDNISVKPVVSKELNGTNNTSVTRIFQIMAKNKHNKKNNSKIMTNINEYEQNTNKKIMRRSKEINQTNTDINKKRKSVNNETQVAVESNRPVMKNSPSSVREAIKSIKTISQLEAFAVRENKVRDSYSKTCKLNHLNRMQWNMLNNLVTDLVGKAKKNKAKSSMFLKKGKEALLMNVD